MATRSTISIQNANGTIDSIYCHWDGYPSNNGALLLKHYSTEEKVRELISLGDISSLGEKVNPTEGSNHSFKTPEKGVTVAYYRDSGEKSIANRKLLGIPGYNKKINREEWNYLWKDGTWYVAPTIEKNFVKLTDEMCVK